MFSDRLSLTTWFALSLMIFTLGDPAEGQESLKETTQQPTASSSNGLTREFLEGVIRVNYNNVKTQGAEKDSFVLWSMDYTSSNTKSPETLHWKLSAQVVEKPGQARMARVWFRCAVMPENPDIEKLHQILFRSGGGAETRAYFRLFEPSKDTRELALVLDVPAEDVTRERLPIAVNGLLDFAYDTSYLWGSMDQPLSKTKAPTETRPKPVSVKLPQLAGAWNGDASSNGEKVGQWSLKMEPDGFFLLSRVDLTAEPPKPQILTGQAKIVEAGLTLTFHQGQPPETYAVDLQQRKFMLSSTADKVVTKIELSK